VSDKRISVEVEESVSSLVIRGVEEEDSATYFCHSTNQQALKLPFLVHVQGRTIYTSATPPTSRLSSYHS
jgi:hypothetical protein